MFMEALKITIKFSSNCPSVSGIASDEYMRALHSPSGRDFTLGEPDCVGQTRNRCEGFTAAGLTV